MANLKAQARHIFLDALRAVDAGATVTRAMRVEGSRLSAAGASFEPDEFSRIMIVAIGKAATPMYSAAVRQLRLAAPAERIEGIVVAPEPAITYLNSGWKMAAEPTGTLIHYQGGHPTPNETSRLAALAILHLLHKADAGTLVLFLISGGASAMLEMPLDPAITIADIAAFNRTLVGCGLSIGEMNVLRKHLSAVKGGRLAIAAAPAAQCTLIVSDVPAGALDAVGSGPSIPDSSTVEECRAIYRRLRASHRLPPRIEAFFESAALPETPKSGDDAFQRAAWRSILSGADLAAAARDAAISAGFLVEVDNSCDEWDYRDAARYLLDRSASLASRGERTCLIFVGEVKVALEAGKPCGVGGRNQHFALQCALEIAKSDLQVTILSAGSDGIDGNSPAAGAVADSSTCLCAAQKGIEPSQSLAAFDSYSLFAALGDTVVTGPTGINLRDLCLFLT